MQKLILCTLFVMIILAVHAQQNIEQTIRDLEQQEVQAVLNKDFSILEKIWAQDMMVNNPYNVIIFKRDEVFDRIHSGVINYASFTRETEEILIFDHMVVSMGNETLIHKEKNQKQSRRYTNIWMQNQGEWQITVRHANFICE